MMQPPRSLKKRALDFLSRREYSRHELRQKLITAEVDEKELDALLTTLEEKGFINDARVVESTINQNLKKFGASRIAAKLREKGLNSAGKETAAQWMEQLKESELERAHGVWRKKFDTLPTTQKERAKQQRFLAGRGFSSAVIFRIIKNDIGSKQIR